MAGHAIQEISWNVSTGTILSIVDFAENYTFVAQNEIQSEYYHFYQVYMFFHILYRHAKQNVDHIESTSENWHVIKDYHFYINNDRTHETHFVQHCFDKIYDSLKGRGIKFNEHLIWSDGCIDQFKSSRSFFWFCYLYKKTHIKHCWNFFETGHGKGEHDGAAACIKWALWRYQMDHYANWIASVGQVFQWCDVALSHQNDPSREVWRYVHIYKLTCI